jgi:hypothetical protein
MKHKAEPTSDDSESSELTVNLGVCVLNYPNEAEMKLIMPVTIYWRPQPDITGYELARLLPLIIRANPLMPNDVPKEPELLRHIEVYNPNERNSGAAEGGPAGMRS